MNNGNIDNRSNRFENEAAKFINDAEPDKPHDTDGKNAECFGHNTADCQKQKRDTYKSGCDGKNIDNFLYHSIAESFSDSPYRQQENYHYKNNFQIHMQTNVHRLSDP